MNKITNIFMYTLYMLVSVQAMVGIVSKVYLVVFLGRMFLAEGIDCISILSTTFQGLSLMN